MWTSISTSLISSSSLIFALFSGPCHTKHLPHTWTHSSDGKAEFSVTFIKADELASSEPLPKVAAIPQKKSTSRDTLINRPALIKAKNPPGHCPIPTSPCQQLERTLWDVVHLISPLQHTSFAGKEFLKIKSRHVKATKRFYHSLLQSPAWITRFVHMYL